MTNSREELVEKWALVRNSEASGREWRVVALSANAPLRILAGIREPDNRIALLLEAPINEAPKDPIRFVANGLSVTDQRRFEENVFRVAIVLERLEVREVFEVLATDITNVAIQSLTSSDAIRAVTRRLEAWQACLRSGRRGLTPEEQIGLFGELTVLEMVAGKIGYPKAISAWGGPLDKVHDFTANGIALEVKCASGISNQLRISKLNQLETEGLRQLFVARVRLQEDPAGKTLGEFVSHIRATIAQSSVAGADFEERLLRIGYIDSENFLYENAHFSQANFHTYEVREDFPRFTSLNIPPGIIDGSYVLDERALLPFRCSPEYFELTMEKMLG